MYYYNYSYYEEEMMKEAELRLESDSAYKDRIKNNNSNYYDDDHIPNFDSLVNIDFKPMLNKEEIERRRNIILQKIKQLKIIHNKNNI